MVKTERIEGILDRARWAPSGDNTQPWRFEILGEDHVAIHGFDTRDHVLYDFDGRASQLAHGALLETLRLAAGCQGLRADWSIRPGCADTAPVYDVRLVPDATLEPDPLAEFIESRVVQRRPMRTTPLDASQRAALVDAVGPGFTLRFFESLSERMAVAKLLWANAHIRLTTPEAFEVHCSIIEWGARYSDDRIPEQAVGVDPATARLMRWVMQSWERVRFFNRYLLGTVAPRIQLDLLPALGCAAHILVQAPRPPQGLADYLAAGAAMQRLWLAAEAQGLHLQPEMTPVIFRWYARAGRSLSAKAGINAAAARLAQNFEAIVPASRDDAFMFFCRVGRSAAPHARSLRLPLASLLAGRS
ncbi:MAG TPA: molybdopterin biosynthesis protein MoeY [Rhodocyclaceae bacterium]|nr:molybdopterin biosynthesis protein MoeY [Rhodocyclaceae bacterium]